MIAHVETFIRYAEPLRSRRTAREIVATWLISLVALAYGLWQVPAATSVYVIPWVLALLVGFVTLVIGGALLRNFVLGRVHEVCVTNQGITSDGTFWPWDVVSEVRFQPLTPGVPACLWITVRRGLISRLSLLVLLRDSDAPAGAHALREFLALNAPHVAWRTRRPIASLFPRARGAVEGP